MREVWQTARFRIDLTRPRVMGIVNVTPDSFSDGGRHGTASAAIEHCHRLVGEGADILDIGGESSRPGALQLSVEEEWGRVEPVLVEAVKLGVPVSVDSFEAEVMQRALGAGADILNDIHALQSEAALRALQSHPTAGVCLMHMRGDSATMQSLTQYEDVVTEVAKFLGQRSASLLAAGIGGERITLDPGYGFAKTSEQNLTLLARQPELLRLGHPLLIGLSRKRTIGDITGRPVDQRLAGSLAAALAAVAQGARIIRVHDVAETVDALKVWMAASAPISVADNDAHKHSGGCSQ